PPLENHLDPREAQNRNGAAAPPSEVRVQERECPKWASRCSQFACLATSFRGLTTIKINPEGARPDTEWSMSCIQVLRISNSQSSAREGTVHAGKNCIPGAGLLNNHNRPRS